MTARPLHAAALVAVLAVAVALPLHYAPHGFMPLDQSIVFDGGWRILSGQRPFADFVTPIGLVPSAMQAALFWLAGVTWGVYAAHAAALNAAFALLAYAIMRLAGSGRSSAVIVALASAVVFYPPFAVPFPDQHSLFFSLAALWATARGRIADRRGRCALLAVPTLAASAFASKHVPALFLAGPVVVAATVMAWRRSRAAALAAFAAPGVIVAGYLALPGVSAADAWYYGVVLPLGTGRARVATSEVASHWLALWHDADPPLAAISLGAGLWLLGLWRLGRTRREDGAAEWRRGAARLGVAGGVGVSTVGALLVTNNSPANGLGLVPLAVGLAWLGLDGLLAHDVARRGGPRWLPAALAAALSVVALADTWRFDRGVNAQRRVHPGWREGPGTWSPTTPALRSLRLGRHDGALVEALDYLSHHPGNFLVYGDESVLYGAAGRPSPFPALFMHPDLTIPPEGTRRYAAFEEAMLTRLRDTHVRFVLERIDGPYMGPPIARFPRVQALLSGCPSEELEWWVVTEVCRP